MAWCLKHEQHVALVDLRGAGSYSADAIVDRSTGSGLETGCHGADLGGNLHRSNVVARAFH